MWAITNNGDGNRDPLSGQSSSKFGICGLDGPVSEERWAASSSAPCTYSIMVQGFGWEDQFQDQQHTSSSSSSCVKSATSWWLQASPSSPPTGLEKITGYRGCDHQLIIIDRLFNKSLLRLLVITKRSPINLFSTAHYSCAHQSIRLVRWAIIVKRRRRRRCFSGGGTQPRLTSCRQVDGSQDWSLVNYHYVQIDPPVGQSIAADGHWSAIQVNSKHNWLDRPVCLSEHSTGLCC